MGDEGASAVQGLVKSASDPAKGTIATIIGLVTLLFGATTVFAELRTDLNRIWRCKLEKVNGIWDFVRTRLLSFGLVLSIGFLLLVSLVVSAVLSALGDFLMPSSAIAARIAELLSSLAALTLLFAMIYKLLPSRRIEWRDVWVGAAVTSALFYLGKFAIGLYIAKSSVGSAFGAAGTVVVIIAWVYYSSLIFFFGAEFTREYALLHGSKRFGIGLEEPKVGEVLAANDEHHLIDRAKAIVKGKDPILTREKPTS
jgi:membrane protein